MATISKPDRSLDSSILAAFKVAHDQGKLEVAEHLLSALECLVDSSSIKSVTKSLVSLHVGHLKSDCMKNGIN